MPGPKIRLWFQSGSLKKLEPLKDTTMKRRLAVAVLAALSTPGLAADMAVKSPAYAPLPSAVYTWTGFYLGGNVGYSWGKGRADYNDSALSTALALPATLSGSQNVDGVIGGGQIGFNWQANSNW